MCKVEGMSDLDVAIWAALLDDRVGRRFMVCPNCRGSVDIEDDECECGFDFIDGRPW
jgi:hypothetical protein